MPGPASASRATSSPVRDPRALGDRALTTLALLAPGLLLAVLSFQSGGFFPDWSATATMAVLLALVLWATLARAPFAGASRALLVAGAALAGFTVWVLISGSWSNAWSRALLEYSRDLGYLALLVLTGLLGRSAGRARMMVLGLAAAGALVGIAALAAWVRPDVVEVGSQFSRERLSWPLSYWNATGLVAALSALWCVHLTSADRSRAVRVLAAAAVPLLVPAVYFTVSRGAAAAGLLGLVVYVVTGPSRGLLTGGAVALAAAALSVVVAAGTDGLDQTTVDAAGLASGKDAAAQLLALAAGAAVVRAALLPIDARLARRILGRRFRRRAWALAGAGAAVAIVAGLALGGVDRVHQGYDDLVADRSVAGRVEASRFTELSANGRIGHWRVALDDGFDAQPLHGTGAGTYEVLWARNRHTTLTVVDAHSLYVEVLAELGVVGLALLLVALLTGLGALARRTRGVHGPTWAALLATTVAWAIHAGVDWDWEMPALTYTAIGAMGLALGAPVARVAWGRTMVDGREAAFDDDDAAVHDAGAVAAAHTPDDVDGLEGEDDAGPPAALPGPGMTLRVGVGLGCLLLALLPLSVLRSQDRLREAVTAFRSGDCSRAVDRSLASTSALGARPEPFEVLAWCDLRLGNVTLADRAIDAAIRRDPGNWELRYSKALIRASTGRDPRAAYAAAQVRNPRNGLVLDAERWLGRRHSAKGWRTFALHAPLPLQ